MITPPTSTSILSLAPENNPRIWFFVNFFILLVSVLLFIYLLIASDEEMISERPFAMYSYLVYNFMTCIVWCIECGLGIAWDSYHGEGLTFARGIEIGAAGYYSWRATDTILTFKRNDGKINGNIRDVLLNCLGYLVLVLATRQLMIEKEKDGQDEKVVPRADDSSGDKARLV